MERHEKGIQKLDAASVKELKEYKTILCTNLEVKETDMMKIFNCNPKWPICMFDFTYKNKSNQ